MPAITFIEDDGTERRVETPLGHSVMEGARDAGIHGILAECGGACACSTCHVFVREDWVSRLPPIDAMEEDMLDFAPGAVAGGVSRLSCQLRVTPELDGLVLRVPAEQA